METKVTHSKPRRPYDKHSSDLLYVINLLKVGDPPIFRVITLALKLPLDSAGYRKINLNRIKQEMRFLGFSCETAANISKQFPNQILSSKVIRADYGTESVTYSSADREYRVRYPDSYTFNPKRTFKAGYVSSLPTASDLSAKYSGVYQISDFAYGQSANVTFVIDNTIRAESEQFNNTWSRDQWANAIEVQTGNMIRISYYDNSQINKKVLRYFAILH